MKSSFNQLLALASVVFAGLFFLSASTAQAQMAPQLYGEAVKTYNAGDVAGAKHKLELALEVDKTFKPASDLLNRIDLAERQQKPGADGAVPLPLKTLGQTVFPLEFKDTSLETALEYIRQQVEEKTGGKASVNFVMQLPPELAKKKITLRLDHAPVTEMLRYIGDLAGVSFQNQKYAIAVVPAGAADAPQPTPRQ